MRTTGWRTKLTLFLHVCVFIGKLVALDAEGMHRQLELPHSIICVSIISHHKYNYKLNYDKNSNLPNYIVISVQLTNNWCKSQNIYSTWSRHNQHSRMTRGVTFFSSVDIKIITKNLKYNNLIFRYIIIICNFKQLDINKAFE